MNTTIPKEREREEGAIVRKKGRQLLDSVFSLRFLSFPPSRVLSRDVRRVLFMLILVAVQASQCSVCLRQCRHSRRQLLYFTFFKFSCRSVSFLPLITQESGRECPISWFRCAPICSTRSILLLYLSTVTVFAALFDSSNSFFFRFFSLLRRANECQYGSLSGSVIRNADRM